MKVTIAKPKEFYKEVEGLIEAYYKSAHISRILNPRDSFGRQYPIIYGLFLEIAALGLGGRLNGKSKTGNN